MIADRVALMDLIPFYVLSVFGLYLYFSVTSFVDAPNRKKELKINLVDYLENHMVNRLAILDSQEEPEDCRVEKKERAHRKMFSQQDEDELKVLLKEFL